MLFCANFCVMRKTGPILIVIFLAMLARPLPLPAASCILSNTLNPTGCKPRCCANKECCALSKKSTTPVAPPLTKGSDVKQQQAIGFVAVSMLDSVAPAIVVQAARKHVSGRAHSPPPLAATCIRLI